MDKKIMGAAAAAVLVIVGVLYSMFAEMGGTSGLARDGANRAIDAATGN